MLFHINFGKPLEVVQFQITPDRTAENKKVHDLFRTLSTFYVTPLEILQGKKVSGALWWDVMLQQDSIRFFCTVPYDWKREIRSHLENVWPLSSVEEVLIQTVIPLSADVCEMKYRRSNMFALQTDRRLEYEPLRSILSVIHDMQEGDLARLSICAEPKSRLDWQDWTERQHQLFRKGRTPRRIRLSKKDIFIGVGELITGLLQTVLDTLQFVIGGEENKKEQTDDQEKRMLLVDGQLSRGTINKVKAPTFATHIRIATSSTDAVRQQILLRTLSNSFNDLTADNELERQEVHSKLKPLIIRELNTFRISWPTRLDYDKNMMSNEELGRFVELPTAALQDEFKDRLDSLDSRQIDVPASLTNGGLLLGEISYKKVIQPVYVPTNDHDQLCLPTVVIGGMGSGKTKGFGCNRAIEFVKQGYSAIMIDPAKSEMWIQIEAALPKEKRRRILLGDQPISLDFREVLHSSAARGRLAQIMISFFEDNTDTAGAQTQRFLRAAVMGMKTGKLSEIIKIFTDAEYRLIVIESIAGMHKETLLQFHSESEARQRQILSPIMNRLDVILGDPYLEACMNTDKGIDLVNVLDELGVCTVFDVPDRLNTRFAKDLLINLVSFKIDAAMTLRKKEHPVAIIYDEPHQYLRSAKLWENAAVESRKYRLAYHWLFHSFEQIPRQLIEIIKAAGPHYVLYPSSKATYKGLQEEITPFTIEDGLATKRYHAICALKVGESRLSPFIAKMAGPPAQ